MYREGLNPEQQVELACKDEGLELNKFIQLSIRLDPLLDYNNPRLTLTLHVHTTMPETVPREDTPMVIGRSRLTTMEHQ